MVEEKVYCRHEGEHSQNQGHLGEPSVGMTCEPCDEKVEDRSGREGKQLLQPRGQKVKGVDNQISALYMEEPLGKGQPRLKS